MIVAPRVRPADLAIGTTAEEIDLHEQYRMILGRRLVRSAGDLENVRLASASSVGRHRSLRERIAGERGRVDGAAGRVVVRHGRDHRSFPAHDKGGCYRAVVATQ